MNESEIRMRYKDAPDSSVSVYATYTTRLDDFYRIALTRTILCSEEAYRLFGDTVPHRKLQGMRNVWQALNSYISFSPGLVSFKYYDRDINSREDWVGGVGIFIPIEKILSMSPLSFSHCSNQGNFPLGDGLNKDNICQEVHEARRQGLLCDDGYGNMFEIMIDSIEKDTEHVVYPRIRITTDTIMAAPAYCREYIMMGVTAGYQRYREILDSLDAIGRREVVNFLGSNLQTPENVEMSIKWYLHRNLEVALQDLSVRS